jgi:hypothetical protein
MSQATWFERVVALLGVALIGLLWAPWYYGGMEGAYFNRSPEPSYVATIGGASGWNTGTVTSIVVACVGALCVAQLVALWRERSPAIGLAWNVGVTWAALILVVWLLVRVVWPPDDALRDWGVWTSLIVAGGILVTSWLGMQDERTAKARPRDVPIRPIPPPPAPKP